MTLSLEYEPAALNLATAPSTAVNCATHIGTKIDIRPLLSAIVLIVLAVPSVTQPPHINPIVIAATAPAAIPWRKRVRASPCKISGIFMSSSFCLRAESRSHRGCCWHPRLLEVFALFDCAFRWHAGCRYDIEQRLRTSPLHGQHRGEQPLPSVR